MKKKRFLILLVLILPGIIIPFEQKEKTGEETRKEFACYKTRNPIKLGGELKEEDWSRASVIENFYTWNAEGKLKYAISRTKVRILWDDKNLYIGAELEDKDIFAIETSKKAICQDDVFEIFIKPLTEKTHYYEFHISPKNQKLQFFIPRRGCGSLDRFYFSSGIKSAVRLSGTLNNWKDIDKGWTVEAAIPFSAFSMTTAPPQDGTKWFIFFGRYDYSYYLPQEYFKGVELSFSAALSKRNFHLYEDYDIIVFSDR